MLHLALLNQVPHSSSDVLDRNIRIDAVLIEEIDDIGSEALEGSLGDFLDVLGPAIQTSLLSRPRT